MVRTALASVFSLLVLGSPLALALDDDPVEALQAFEEIPDERLLDVGIHVFDSGIPEEEYDRYLLEEKGIYEEIRKSEARWIPINLKRTLEATGYWGAVRM